MTWNLSLGKIEGTPYHPSISFEPEIIATIKYYGETDGITAAAWGKEAEHR